MVRDARPEFIGRTTEQGAAELAHRGVSADQRVTIMIVPYKPEDWLGKARKFPRAKEERKAVQPENG